MMLEGGSLICDGKGREDRVWKYILGHMGDASGKRRSESS